MSDLLGKVDLTECERLAGRASEGDRKAWTDLVARLWPALEHLVRSNRSMGRARSDDDVREVLTTLFEKLGARSGHGLKLYGSWRERHPDKEFEDWLRIVVKNAIRDRARETLGPRTASGEPSAKRLLNEFASSPALERLGARPPMTAAQTARQLLEYSQAFLPRDQYRALTVWLDGGTFEEIGSACQKDGEGGRMLLRAAIAVLRRKFAGRDE